MASSAAAQPQNQKRHVSYADYYKVVYKRKNMTYAEYDEMLVRYYSRKQAEAQAEAQTQSWLHRRRDPHAVLGVLPGCSQKDLKTAFHKRVWALHPDRKASHERSEAEHAFKELSEAYRKLSGGDGLQQCWPFGRGRNLKPRLMREYSSIFVEFMGVTRREREPTVPHVLRSILCDRLVPRHRRLSIMHR